MCPRKIGCKLSYCPLPTFRKKELCQGHYRQLERTGVTHPIKDPLDVLCHVPGCGTKIHGLGLCHSHYNAYKRGLVAEDENCRCTFGGCTIIHYAKGLCQLHYSMSRAVRISDKLQQFVVRIHEPS